MDWKYEHERIYCVDDKNELMAEVSFVRKKNKEVDIDHVYVNPFLRGQGVAEQAMLILVDYLRKEGLKAIATCPYAIAWLKKHKELYSDIISEDTAV